LIDDVGNTTINNELPVSVSIVVLNSPRLQGQSLLFAVVPGVLFPAVIRSAAKHFIFVRVIVFISGESA
jgi:hypothetical protein